MDPATTQDRVIDMPHDDIHRLVHELSRKLEMLQAEADVRRLQGRYMSLCDTPCPEFGVIDDEQRIERIMELYVPDATWEGVGEYYDHQFGRKVGHEAIRAHFRSFWGETRDPALVLNAHYLTSEQIRVSGEEAEGNWIHCQPWIFSDGSSLLRSSRLNNAFRRVDGVWKIARTRTENVFVAPLRSGWAESVATISVLMRPGCDHSGQD